MLVINDGVGVGFFFHIYYLLHVSDCGGPTHHSHLGEVDQTVICNIGCPVLNESQVCQIEAQVGNSRRIDSEDRKK